LAERDLIQLSIDCSKKFLNWLRTSCTVSITTVVTWHTWTVDFCADIEQRIIGRATNEWQNDCWACVKAKRQHSNMCCNFWYRKTVLLFWWKHCL